MFTAKNLVRRRIVFKFDLTLLVGKMLFDSTIYWTAQLCSNPYQTLSYSIRIEFWHFSPRRGQDRTGRRICHTFPVSCLTHDERDWGKTGGSRERHDRSGSDVRVAYFQPLQLGCAAPVPVPLFRAVIPPLVRRKGLTPPVRAFETPSHSKSAR